MPGEENFGKGPVAQEVPDVAAQTNNLLNTNQQATTQTQASVPPGFISKPQAQSTTAKSILQSEGISSSRQLLDKMKVPSAKEILASAGITSPTDILAAEKKKQEADSLETYYQEQEKEFLKNYKFDPNDFNPTQYETKYGVINLKDMKYSNGTHFPKSEVNVTIAFTDPKTGEMYHFLPEGFINQGAKNSQNNNQVYNTAFLNKDTYEALKNYGQYIDISDTDFSFIEQEATEQVTPNLQSFTKTDFYTEEFQDATGATFYRPSEEALAKMNANTSLFKNKLQEGNGFIFSSEDWKKFSQEHLDGNYYNWGALSDKYGIQYGGDIAGIAEKDGKLIYVTSSPDPKKYGHDAMSSWIDDTANVNYYWYNKPKRKKDPLSQFVYGVGDVFNAIPFGAELLVIATGGAALPYYPSIKGAQTVSAGGDLGQTLTSMAIAALPQTGIMEGISASTTDYIATTFGVEAATAQVMSSAIISAGFNGTIAALTGQDVEKAVIAGALTGGIQAGIPAVAKELFKGVDVSGVAKTLNMTEKQFQNVLVSSVGNAAVASAVYGRDFFETFSQTLVTSGLSQAAANEVKDQFASTADPKKVQQAVNLTRATVSAGARSAIRGTNFDMELQKSFAGLINTSVNRQMQEAMNTK